MLINLGNDTFGPAMHFAVGSQPSWIAVSDLNGDSQPDLAVSSYDDDNVSLLLNTLCAK